MRADPDGRLWIRTSEVLNGVPVYDIANRQGQLVDRLQLPKGRVLAGFGSGGVLYLGVLHGNGARVEKARID